MERALPRAGRLEYPRCGVVPSISALVALYEILPAHVKLFRSSTFIDARHLHTHSETAAPKGHAPPVAWAWAMRCAAQASGWRKLDLKGLTRAISRPDSWSRANLVELARELADSWPGSWWTIG